MTNIHWVLFQVTIALPWSFRSFPMPLLLFFFFFKSIKVLRFREIMSSLKYTSAVSDRATGLMVTTLSLARKLWAYFTGVRLSIRPSASSDSSLLQYQIYHTVLQSCRVVICWDCGDASPSAGQGPYDQPIVVPDRLHPLK